MINASYEKGFCQSCLQLCTQALAPSCRVSHGKRITRPENEAATATGFEPQRDLPVSVFLLRNVLDGGEWALKSYFHPFEPSVEIHCISPIGRLEASS